MYQPIAGRDKWDQAARRFYREKLEIFTKTVWAVSERENVALKEEEEGLCAGLLTEMGLLPEKEGLAGLKSFLKSGPYHDLVRCGTAAAKAPEVFRTHLYKLDETERKRMQDEGKASKKLKLVDLFCGAGGLSLGFVQAGCRVIFANDFDELCIKTYQYNHPEIPKEAVWCRDIREIAGHIGKLVPEDADIVIGGPPCQGFSFANKHHRVINDPRNELYKYYIKAVGELAPKVVVMENVKGMLKVAGQVVEDYEGIRAVRDGREYTYRISYGLLNSADFSVAQSRERLIYIALREDVVSQKGVCPEDIFRMIEENNQANERFPLSAALEGVRALEPPEVMGVGEVDTEEAGRKIDRNPFTGKENEYLRRINGGREMPLVFNHKARYLSPVNHEIYRRLNPGDDATDPKIADIMPYASRNDKFKDKYFRLYGDRPCRTITAHLRSDCHSHIHPTQARALTPREAARVQSFPDDYLFLGPYLKTYTQIGNAVPPLMAKGIAQVLVRLLNGS